MDVTLHLYVLFLFVWHGLASTTRTILGGYYSMNKDVVIVGETVRMYTPEIVKCLLQCNVASVCYGVNYHHLERMCDLVPRGDAGTTTESRPGWTSAVKHFNCPLGFEKIGGGCYFLQKSAVQIDIGDAKSACSNRSGSDLASIESFAEFSKLQQVFKEIYQPISGDCVNGWMLNARRFDKDGPFTWATGSELDVLSPMWAEGQPETQECVAFWPPSFYLADIFCTTYFQQYICEL